MNFRSYNTRVLSANDSGSTTLGGQFAARVPIETLDHARDIGLSLLRTFADRPSYVLGVTSALPREGKTTISLGLAEVMATDFGLEVVLLDCNAERPWTPEMPSTDAESWNGLSDWLSDECTVNEAIYQLHDKCSVIPFGTQSITSRDLLQYLVKSDAFSNLRERFSLVLVDLPDLANPAAPALANLCDGLVLVLRSGDTPVDIVREFLPLLANVTIHGVVLNRHRPAVPAAIRNMFS